MDDLISRQAAIDALEWGITYAKAINKETGEMRELFAESNDELRKAVDRVKALPSAQPQWIPVTERLPEYGTGVVTINKDDEYEINHVIDEEDGEWFFDGAVAWMPLPDPWKGE